MQGSRKMVRTGVCGIGKTVVILIAVVAVLGLSGCSLIDWDDVKDNGEVYFYDLVTVEKSGENDYTLEYVNGGEYTVIMSRSVGWKRLTEEEAADYRDNYTEFRFSADGEAVKPEGERGIKNLGWLLPDWHVVQEFSIGPFEQEDEVKLKGITHLNGPDEGDEPRTNTVKLTFK